jgi:HAE1 family hydrophobic/amphiphilic exporter-1
MTITELSIKRPTLVIIVCCALVVLGLFSYYGLSYELLPKISPPMVSVTTIYPGASPDEVETSVTKKVEDAVSGIDKVKIVKSTSMEGVSAVAVEFLNTADVDLALQDVQRKVREIEYLLPSEAKTPTISKIAFDELPILRVAVTSDRSPREFFILLKDQIKPQLAKISGVAQVDFVGGEQREIRVNLSRQKIDNYSLSVAQVTQIIKASDLDFPTGTIKDADEQYVVRVAGKIEDVAVLRNLIVGRSKAGGNIRLADVADIQDGRAEITQTARLNGVTGIGMLIRKQSNANAVDVSSDVKNKLKELESTYASENLRFTVAQDDATFTIASANAVKFDIVVAIFLVAVVMLLFLHSTRNSLIVLVTIPVALISTVMVVKGLGYTLNIMTLLGMSTVIGIVVDDSIVILENIHRHLEMGEDKRRASLAALKEIGLAALSIALVIVAVMVPLVFVQGAVGNALHQFAAVVIASTLFSLAVSFTLTPMLASRFAVLEHLTRKTVIGRFAVWFEEQYKKVAAGYTRLLTWSLAHAKGILITGGVVFLAALSLIPLGFVGTEFVPSTDDGNFNMTIEATPGIKFEDMNRTTRAVEERLAKIPEVELLFPNVGTSSDLFSSQSSNNISSIQIRTVEKNDRSKTMDDLGREMRAAAAQVPGVKARMNTVVLGMSTGAPIQVLLTGSNRDDVMEAGKIVEGIVRQTPGAIDVRLSSEEGKPEMRVDIDRDKMANLGLSLAHVGGTLRVALTGDDDAKFRDGANQYDIRVMLDQFDRTKTSDVGNLSFTNVEGRRIQLKQFARIYRATGPSKLERSDRNAGVQVNAEVSGRGSGTVAQDIARRLEGSLPAGVTATFKGHTEYMGETFTDLGISFIAAILFVYMIMVALFDSFLHPFVVLFSIPGALIGAILMLALTMNSLNMLSVLGLIMMIGLVTKDAILLVDRTNQVRAQRNLGVVEALLEAARTRFRPILMTTVAMVLGMMPLALATNPGSELKTGMGWAIAGGLSSALFITLLLVPVVYAVLDQLKVRLAQKFGRNRTTADDQSLVPEISTVSSDYANE